jgi:hypothetical protein
MEIRMADINVTSKVLFGHGYYGVLSLIKCVCGEAFEPGEFYIYKDRNDPMTCGACGRELYFQRSIQVFERRVDA